MRKLIDLLWAEWKAVEDQIKGLSRELERISADDAGCTRLRRIPGIGPIVATAIVAAIGNGAAFRKARDFAAWLGVVPRQYSTGGKTRLLGISKRGNVYLRKVLIHGARAAVLHMKRDRAPIGAWLDALDARAPKNVVAVAMANNLARISWAVLSSGEDYKPASNLVTAS
jgi:transposase